MDTRKKLNEIKKIFLSGIKARGQKVVTPKDAIRVAVPDNTSFAIYYIHKLNFNHSPYLFRLSNYSYAKIDMLNNLKISDILESWIPCNVQVLQNYTLDQKVFPLHDVPVNVMVFDTKRKEHNAYREPSIKDYASKETLDSFQGLYNFIK